MGEAFYISGFSNARAVTSYAGSIRVGKVIYFSGPDGAGKTTSFLKVVETLERSGVSVFQLRTLQVARLKLMMCGRPEGNYEGRADNRLGSVGRLGYSSLPRHRGSGLRFTSRRYLGLLFAILDIAIFGPIFLKSKLSLYDVVLVEESPFDVFAKRHRPFFSLTAKLLSRFIPEPDLLIYCVADPCEIERRKPELVQDEIRHYYKVMNKIHKIRPNLNIFNHDTNPSPDPYSAIETSVRDLFF